MTLIVPDAAEEKHIDRILGIDLELRLFKNDVTDGLTAAQIEALDETDFVEADFTGYAAIVLASAGWTSTPGDPTQAVFAQQTFESTADQAAQVIYGYYVVKDSDGSIEWFEVFGDPPTVQTDGDLIKVTPTFTYQDAQD